MILRNLELRNFRNYEEEHLEFDSGVNLIVGDNAQGKTNLLEAISYLGSGKSFRAQKTAEMVRFGADFGEISGGVFSQEREQTLRYLLFSGSRPRQIWRNGVMAQINWLKHAIRTAESVLFNRLSGKWSSADQAADRCLTSG